VAAYTYAKVPSNGARIERQHRREDFGSAAEGADRLRAATRFFATVVVNANGDANLSLPAAAGNDVEKRLCRVTSSKERRVDVVLSILSIFAVMRILVRSQEGQLHGN